MHSDDIIETVGGFSWFQLYLGSMVGLPTILLPFGMLMMSFAGAAPEEWYCTYPDLNATSEELKTCPSAGNFSLCKMEYSSEKNTVVNEWDLLCSRAWIKPFMTSVQMGGVLVGAMLCGHIADGIGRKKTFYISFFLHAAFNLAAAFSVSWEMFAVLRFFIGTAVGAVLVVFFTFIIEFVGAKWRPMLQAIPLWAIGTAFHALVCWLRPDWSVVHLIAAGLHVPFFFGWFFVPESFRWLAINGKLEEAERVIDLMARCNGTEKPSNTREVLSKIAEYEVEAKGKAKQYTYLDIYNNWSICKTTIILQILWACCSFVFYGIQFGVGRLTGSLYVNMFIIGVISIPANVVVFPLSNKIGRRWTIVIFFIIAALGAFGVVAVSHFITDSGTVTTVLAMICRMGVAATWGGVIIITNELYPTTIRNLGYGASNTFARVGGILSPYIFAMGDGGLMTPFLIVGGVMAVCVFLPFALQETKGKPLMDTMSISSPDKQPIYEIKQGKISVISRKEI